MQHKCHPCYPMLPNLAMVFFLLFWGFLALIHTNPILSLSHPILSHPVLSYAVLSHPILFYPIPFHPILANPIHLTSNQATHISFMLPNMLLNLTMWCFGGIFCPDTYLIPFLSFPRFTPSIPPLHILSYFILYYLILFHPILVLSVK